MKTTIRREITVTRTPRYHQLCGKFDLNSTGTSSIEWDVDVQLPAEWSVGVIVGPSMAGKSTLANELFPGELVNQGDWDWPKDQCIGDGFPAETPIDDITGFLSSVGFSSPPDWLKPYHALSDGGRFRVDLAPHTGRSMIDVKIEKQELVIRLPIQSPPVPCSSGKTMVVASTHT